MNALDVADVVFSPSRHEQPYPSGHASNTEVALVGVWRKKESLDSLVVVNLETRTKKTLLYCLLLPTYF